MLSLRTLQRLLLLPTAFALVLAAGCATDNNARQQRLARNSPESLYAQGQEALRAHDFAYAVEIYSALSARYPFTAQSRQARLEIIYAYYRLGEKESAKDAAETFIRENPSHPRIDYAWYLQGLIDFERMPHAVERWMGVDFAARPPDSQDAAFEAFNTVVTKFPTSIYAPDARRRMVYLRNRLADYELRIARHYMDRSAWVAAAQRARQTIEQYDGAPAVKEALRIMIRCYDEIGYTELAENTRKVFLENFPGESPKLDFRQKNWWELW